ncbi:hypothetical protein BpHYR1_013083 [Brachionus plicatilis]|uniref:Uncharacterized protein n=1 Tax=Brachionus plicatilis TaxID=10195 RepID=A0A3M7PQC3_BRAPC|nr:hypothetical protein BpHYR1_013083 [Brachionus plicatilis]
MSMISAHPSKCMASVRHLSVVHQLRLPT